VQVLTASIRTQEERVSIGEIGVHGSKDILKASRRSHDLMIASIDLGTADFEGKRLKRTGTLAVLFAAEWCPFCRRFTSIFDSVLSSKGISRGLVDLSDLENPLWEEFDIDVVPSVMVFREGELVYRIEGILGRGLPDNVMDEVMLNLPEGSKATS
jgi:thioredoxin 1